MLNILFYNINTLNHVKSIEKISFRKCLLEYINKYT